MANAKITALPANTSPALTDVLPIVDDPGGSPVTQKVTVADLMATSGVSLNNVTVNSVLLAVDGINLVTTGIIIFPASQTASANANALDDYEEGTWTPTVAFATPGTSTWTSYSRVATYTKIGHLVTALWSFDVTLTKGTGSGACIISGLPFTIANDFMYPLGSGRATPFTLAGTAGIMAFGNSNATTAQYLLINAAGAASVALGAAHLANGVISFMGNLTYEV